ncbi:MAG: hypothetical protein HKN22_00645, partial [Bacteroidia bacterium]|nr:hypothetical protein [Bacteroidia bacterium]
ATTVSWLIATFISKPESNETLENFYKRVKPQGAWNPIHKLSGITKTANSLPALFICWISAVFMTYSILFITGKLILQEYQSALIYALCAILSLIILKLALKRTSVL